MEDSDLSPTDYLCTEESRGQFTKLMSSLDRLLPVPLYRQDTSIRSRPFRHRLVCRK